MSNSARKINRRIATNLVNWAGTPKKRLSLRQRMALLLMKVREHQHKQAQTATEAFQTPEELTPEAIAARKEADEPANASIQAPEGL